MLLFPSLLVAALTVSASAADKLPTNVAKTAKAAKAAANGKAKASPAPPQPQPTPAQPVVPLRPSQMPSVAPRVSYQQGMLTVVAENCTIADILSAIRTATGIRIESVGGPSGDRVAAKIGPARPREVLLSLLQGSRFDYVMLGSVSDPERIERVVLSPKLGAAPAPPPQAVAQHQEPVRDTDQENDPVDLSQPDSEEAGAPPLRGDAPGPPGQEQQQQQPQQGAQVQPGYPQQEPGQNSTNPNPQLNQAQPNAQQQGQGQQGQQQVKTPEQLLEELRMRQQQQQQQEPEQQQSPEQQREQQQQPEQQQPEQQQQQPPDDSNPQQ